MVNYDALIQRDLQHIWHPCTQMKDLAQHPPLVVKHAQGSYLYTDQGPIIDATSSWWCKALGHQHPAVTAAIKEQLNHFEQIIGANTTHPLIVELAEELSEITGLQHAFFASDGSTAVEIAVKLALQSAKHKGYTSRNQFIALKNGYHGESMATNSISNLNFYKDPTTESGLTCHFLQNIPYINHQTEALWKNCEQQWHLAQQELDAIKDNVCAIILEPIVQGVGGMLCYSADFLKRLAVFAKANDIYLIVDEIMTGMGRTGKWLAIDHADIKADMICLSKGLTSGTVPMSCVMIDHEIFNLFYHDYATGKSFLHSNTFSGNALAVSAALATINVIKTEHINEQAVILGQNMLKHFTDVAEKTGKLCNIRSIGAIVAGDLIASKQSRMGYQVQQAAIQRGALFRPLGNTLYWLPPLTTDQFTIEKLAEITLNSIEAVYSKEPCHEKEARHPERSEGSPASSRNDELLEET